MSEGVNFYSIVEEIPYPLICAKVLAEKINVPKACIRAWVSSGSLPPYDWRMSSQTYGWRKESLYDFFTNKGVKTDVKKNTTTESNREQQRATESNNEEQGMNEMSDFEKSLQSNPKISSVTIYQTTDYDIFKLDPHNRPISENRAKGMAKDGFEETVILVDKNGVILDGQHRWRAAQLANKPLGFYIIQNEVDKDFVAKINSNTQGWTIAMYAQRFLGLGSDDYAEFMKLKTKYGKFIGSTRLLSLLLGADVTGGGVFLQSFKKGSYKSKINSAFVEKALDYMVELKKLYPNIFDTQFRATKWLKLALLYIKLECTGKGCDKFHKKVVKQLKNLPKYIQDNGIKNFLKFFQNLEPKIDFQKLDEEFTAGLNAGQYL